MALPGRRVIWRLGGGLLLSAKLAAGLTSRQSSILGPQEIAAGVAKIKTVTSGVERVLPLAEVVAALPV